MTDPALLSLTQSSLLRLTSVNGHFGHFRRPKNPRNFEGVERTRFPSNVPLMEPADEVERVCRSMAAGFAIHSRADYIAAGKMVGVLLRHFDHLNAAGVAALKTLSTQISRYPVDRLIAEKRRDATK